MKTDGIVGLGDSGFGCPTVTTPGVTFVLNWEHDMLYKILVKYGIKLVRSVRTFSHNKKIKCIFLRPRVYIEEIEFISRKRKLKV